MHKEPEYLGGWQCLNKMQCCGIQEEKIPFLQRPPPALSQSGTGRLWTGEGVDETTPGSADAREAGKCSSDETEESGGNIMESALMV